MSAPTTWVGRALGVCGGLLPVVFAIVGCGPAGGTDGTSFGSSSSGGGSSVSPSTNTTPVVVLVDPDRTLTAQPGQGVGVFTEYQTGGHWHVWWTCDSTANGSGVPCFFDVLVSVPSGRLTISDANPGSPSLQRTPQSIESSTATTTGIDQIYFDATPGQAIQLDAQLNGIHDGRFLFFVQNGLVNGGYTGTLSDPLILSPGG